MFSLVCTSVKPSISAVHLLGFTWMLNWKKTKNLPEVLDIESIEFGVLVCAFRHQNCRCLYNLRRRQPPKNRLMSCIAGILRKIIYTVDRPPEVLHQIA